MNLAITKWNYIGTPDWDYIGPMAQDFYKAFNIGKDSTHINVASIGDIALVTIKELGKQNADLATQNQTPQNQLAIANQNIASQQSQIDELRDGLLQLKEMQIQCCNLQQGGSNNSQTDQPRLDQNIPNPFYQNTTIGYYLPANTTSASINIKSLDGKSLMTFEIKGHGMGQILIQGGTLMPGTYVYNLIVNGNQIDSKKMVLIGQ